VNYLLDTNVVSEVMKKSPDKAILSWVAQNEAGCFLSAITVGEIEKGIELLSPGRKKQGLQQAFHEFFSVLEERVLGFDLPVARRWAVMTAAARRRGRVVPVLDSMIEATAFHWKLTVVTRNTSDFTQAETFNPWAVRA